MPNLGKGNKQPSPGIRVSNRINPNRTTPRYIVIKWQQLKIKRILKLGREKPQITYKGTPVRLSVDFSAETLQARREWHNIFKGMKGKNQEYSTQQDSPNKDFTDRQKLKEFSTTKPAL